MLLFSAFSTSNLPPFLLLPLLRAEWRRTFWATSSNEKLKSNNLFVHACPVPLRKHQHPVLPPGNGPVGGKGLLCELTFK